MARRGDGLYLRGKSWYLDCYINGMRHQRRLGKNISRTVAAELAQVQRASILRGEFDIGKKKKDLSFNEARAKFEEWVQAHKRPRTIRYYLECLRRLGESFSGKALSEISPFLVEKHRMTRIKAGARIRVNRELATLKALVNRCKEWDHYDGHNPVTMKLPKEPRQRLRFLEPEEEHRLLQAAGEPLRSLIIVGIHCGLRLASEALTLQWKDIDFKRSSLTVSAALQRMEKADQCP